jgi:hypothetical protein
MAKRSSGPDGRLAPADSGLCVSPEELRREDEATGTGRGFYPGTDARGASTEQLIGHFYC